MNSRNIFRKMLDHFPKLEYNLALSQAFSSIFKQSQAIFRCIKYDGFTAIVILTCACKYFMKKLRRKLFPWRYAPAMETITTWWSLRSSRPRIAFNSSNSKWNEWFTGVRIWTALGEFDPFAQISLHKTPTTKLKAIFTRRVVILTMWKLNGATNCVPIYCVRLLST